jgi:hypothetical protein
VSLSRRESALKGRSISSPFALRKVQKVSSCRRTGPIDGQRWQAPICLKVTIGRLVSKSHDQLLHEPDGLSGPKQFIGDSNLSSAAGDIAPEKDCPHPCASSPRAPRRLRWGAVPTSALRLSRSVLGGPYANSAEEEGASFSYRFSSHNGEIRQEWLTQDVGERIEVYSIYMFPAGCSRVLPRTFAIGPLNCE